jgi:hypothetical protein
VLNFWFDSQIAQQITRQAKSSIREKADAHTVYIPNNYTNFCFCHCLSTSHTVTTSFCATFTSTVTTLDRFTKKRYVLSKKQELY